MGNDPGFRDEMLFCPACGSDRYSAIYRSSMNEVQRQYNRALSVYWCHECQFVWTRRQSVEDIVDPEGRI